MGLLVRWRCVPAEGKSILIDVSIDVSILFNMKGLSFFSQRSIKTGDGKLHTSFPLLKHVSLSPAPFKVHLPTSAFIIFNSLCDFFPPQASRPNLLTSSPSSLLSSSPVPAPLPPRSDAFSSRSCCTSSPCSSTVHLSFPRRPSSLSPHYSLA